MQLVIKNGGGTKQAGRKFGSKPIRILLQTTIVLVENDRNIDRFFLATRTFEFNC
jgi:hypothetical protein